MRVHHYYPVEPWQKGAVSFLRLKHALAVCLQRLATSPQYSWRHLSMVSIDAAMHQGLQMAVGKQSVLVEAALRESMSAGLAGAQMRCMMS